MSTGGKLGGAAVVGVLLLLLGLSFGGPGSKGDGPAPSPEPEPQPGPKLRFFIILRRGEGANPAARFFLSATPGGGEPRREVTRDQAVEAARTAYTAGGEVWVIVAGDVRSGDWEDFQRELQRQQIPFWGGPTAAPV